MGDIRRSELAVNQSFANFKDPNASTLDTLGSIQAMMKFYEGEGGNDAALTTLKTLGQTETKWLVAGITALEKSPMLQHKLGTGYNAAAQVSEMLKKRQAAKIYDETLDQALKTQLPAFGVDGANGNEIGQIFGGDARLIGGPDLIAGIRR